MQVNSMISKVKWVCSSKFVYGPKRAPHAHFRTLRTTPAKRGTLPSPPDTGKPEPSTQHRRAERGSVTMKILGNAAI